MIRVSRPFLVKVWINHCEDSVLATSHSSSFSKHTLFSISLSSNLCCSEKPSNFSHRSHIVILLPIFHIHFCCLSLFSLTSWHQICSFVRLCLNKKILSLSVCVCVVMWKSEHIFVEEVLFFHLYMGAGCRTQIARLVQETAAEPSCWSLVSLHCLAPLCLSFHSA